MKCSWVWAVLIIRVCHKNDFLVKVGEKVNLQCCIFLVQKENISSSWGEWSVGGTVKTEGPSDQTMEW